MNDETRLGDAREWVMEQAADKGADCPCCGRFTKIYRRTINSGMAGALMVMWRAHGTSWQDKGATLRASGIQDHADEGKLRYWGLIEEAGERRPDGGRAGWWRVTSLGVHFLMGRATVQKWALIYDSECLRLEGPPVTIGDCIDPFRLDQLMSSTARLRVARS